MARKLSITYHLIGPIVASGILYFFLFLLQPLLLLEEVFASEMSSIIFFILIWISLTIVGLIIPPIDLPEEETEIIEN